MVTGQPLFGAALAEIRQAVRGADSLSLFLDFDGTLTPIAEDPSKVRLEESTRELLRALARRPDVLAVIVSGRSLVDLQARVDIGDLVYAGNHGLEISGRGLQFVEAFASSRRELLAQISRSLAEHVSEIGGVRVEYKGLTASVHYRQAPEERIPEIEQIVGRIVDPKVSPFFIGAGKKVLEILPRSPWNKGAAVCWINSRLGGRDAVPIYVGDDRTDETAFRVLPNGITVRVGESEPTSAKFYVAGPGEVRRFLSWLEENKRTETFDGAHR